MTPTGAPPPPGRPHKLRQALSCGVLGPQLGQRGLYPGQTTAHPGPGGAPHPSEPRPNCKVMKGVHLWEASGPLPHMSPGDTVPGLSPHLCWVAAAEALAPSVCVVSLPPSLLRPRKVGDGRGLRTAVNASRPLRLSNRKVRRRAGGGGCPGPGDSAGVSPCPLAPVLPIRHVLWACDSPHRDQAGRSGAQAKGWGWRGPRAPPNGIPADWKEGSNVSPWT